MHKLIVFDMDGVIFEHINFWLELHKAYGTFEEGAALTKKYLKRDYAKLVEEVVGRLWKGKPEQPFLELVDSLQYVQGAKETFAALKKKGYTIAIISSGPRRLAQRAQKELGVDYIYTNELVFADGKATGDFKWPIAAGRKSVALRKLCDDHLVDYKDVVVVGHDENDIKMAKTAGVAIGFCPSSKELESYCSVIVRKKDLKEILAYLE